MSLLGRDNFARDLLVLLLVGVIVASLFSMGLAVTTDKYFAQAVTGVIGDYGQYDLVFSVRSELYTEAQRQLQSIVADRFPGSRIHAGLSIAGKSTIFLSLAPAYRTREVFESIDYFFGNLPGNSGFSIISEPRIVISAVPSGAQELLRKDFGRIPGVSFVFLDGDNLNLMLKSPGDLDKVRASVKRILGRYQLLEVRFPVSSPVSDVGMLGRQLEQAVQRVPGVSLAKDVTRGGSTSDSQYMSAALSELRRFMVAYAARVSVQPVGHAQLQPGDRLILQGRAARLPIPGQVKNDQYVEVKLDQVNNGVGEGLIVQGDASYVKNTSAFRLLPGEKVGEYIGTISVTDERAALSGALDESVKLLQNVQTVAADPAWSDASGSLRSYQGILAQITSVQRMLTAVRDGVGVATAAQTRDRLRQAAGQIQGISGDLQYLAGTMARVKLVEGRVAAVLDRVNIFQSLLRTQASQGLDQGAGGLGQKLIAADQGITAVGENLRQKARQVDDFINRFNPFVQVLLGWGDRARVLAKQLDFFGSALEPGSKGRQTFDSLLAATDSTLKRLQDFNALSLMGEMSRAKERLSSMGQLDLGSIIQQMLYVRNSLPKLLDEEIGRSVGMIDQYLGGDAIPGEKLQILTNAGVDTATAAGAIHRAAGHGQATVLHLPVGSLELDYRGEIFRVLGEVRMTITALVLFGLFLLEFLLDQTVIVAMLRRQTEAMSRRVIGRRPRLARFAAFVLNPARLYAVGFGTLWLWLCTILTGARLPLLDTWGPGVIGGLLGLLLGHLAERINPIDGDEVMAAESLGLPFVLIMREIVIPAGRPGLLQILNRRRLIMRGGGGSRQC